MKYIPAEATECTPQASFSPNAIRVQVYYLKHGPNGGLRGYYLDVAPVEMEAGTEKRFVFTPHGRFGRHQVLFRAAQRLHASVLRTANADANSQVEQQAGVVWDAVVMVAERAGLRLLVTTPLRDT